MSRSKPGEFLVGSFSLFLEGLRQLSSTEYSQMSEASYADQK